MNEIPYVVLIAGIVLIGLYLANRLVDLNVPHWLARKIPHLFGFVAYLLSVYMFSSILWPIILSGGFTVLLLIGRFYNLFRGVARKGTIAEIWYPLSSTIVLAVLWGIFNKPFIAVACIGMMGVGDSVTGIVRSKFCSNPEKHWSGSIAMFLCSSLLAWAFIQPLLLGLITAFFATLTEWLCGDVGKIRWLDDNLAVPLISAAVVVGGLYLV